MLRGFFDSTGLEWRVWEVLPSKAGQRGGGTLSSLKETPFADGWLCFECSNQKRRLAPIPPGWELQDIQMLEELCLAATPVPVRRRRGQMTTDSVSPEAVAPGPA